MEIGRCRDNQVSRCMQGTFLWFEHMQGQPVNRQLNMAFHQPQRLKPNNQKNQIWKKMKQGGLVPEWLLRPKKIEDGKRSADSGNLKHWQFREFHEVWNPNSNQAQFQSKIWSGQKSKLAPLMAIHIQPIDDIREDDNLFGCNVWWHPTSANDGIR